MKFDDLDQKMRVFEKEHDLCVLPGLYMVARVDGRSFTRSTKEIHQFEAPFDPRFRDLMVEAAEHLMSGCGFNMVYATRKATRSLCFSGWKRTAPFFRRMECSKSSPVGFAKPRRKRTMT